MRSVVRFQPPSQGWDPHYYNHRSLLAVLMSNRQIYTEAMPVFYGKNTFGFWNTATGSAGARLKSFTRGTSRRRLSCVRSVELAVRWHCQSGTHGEDDPREKDWERRYAQHFAKSVRQTPNIRRVRLHFSQKLCPHSNHDRR